LISMFSKNAQTIYIIEQTAHEQQISTRLAKLRLALRQMS
jgi:hypothetical protein